VLEELVRFCVELAGHGPGRCTPNPAPDHTAPDHCDPAPAGPGEPLPDPQPLPPGLSRESLEQAVIGRAVALLSGPGGLASFLRRRELGARLGGPSQPLDIGYSNDIPAGIRNAVKARDLHCQWAGGCDQPASACEVHHLRHKSNGGETSLENCILVCFFHHNVMIHRMGWTLVRNPDGTTTAWNRDRSKVLRSHGPPARAG
jgi:5-methylcytosine-specific restriction endonuclease McrA